MSEERNQRPKESSSLPVITLVALIAIVAGLLYIGYQYATDESSSTSEITPNQRQTTLVEPDEEPIEEAPPAEEIAPPAGTTVAPVPLETAPPAQPAESVKTEEPRSEAEVTAAPPRELPKPEPAKPEPKPAPKTEATKPAAVPAGGSSVTHTVQAGQTFYSIATRYNLSPETLKKLNPGVDPSNVKSGTTRLNVKVRAVHTVGPGDILRRVADKYGVTVDQLMKANGKTKNNAQRGEKLIIPYPTKQ
jgi:LysM repeat protein